MNVALMFNDILFAALEIPCPFHVYEIMYQSLKGKILFISQLAISEIKCVFEGNDRFPIKYL